MLAQTQVARVATRFEALIDRFPTPASLAESEVGEILRFWSGLGYNRRAAALHRAAREIVERFDGVIPDQLEDLLALPGLGPYTARAVLAYAFDRSVGPVDANVARVLSRAIGGAPLARLALQSHSRHACSRPPRKGLESRARRSRQPGMPRANTPLL